RQVLRTYSKRHGCVLKLFANHFKRLFPILELMQIDHSRLPDHSKQLIGSYFSMPYSIAAAACFNPANMEHPDQTALARGQKRIIISFRATGEGHISSIVFRQGVLENNMDIDVEPPGKMLEVPEHVKNHTYHKKAFLRKLREMWS